MLTRGVAAVASRAGEDLKYSTHQWRGFGVFSASAGICVLLVECDNKFPLYVPFGMARAPSKSNDEAVAAVFMYEIGGMRARSIDRRRSDSIRRENSGRSSRVA